MIENPKISYAKFFYLLIWLFSDISPVKKSGRNSQLSYAGKVQQKVIERLPRVNPVGRSR